MASTKRDGAFSKTQIYLVVYIVDLVIQWKNQKSASFAVSVPSLVHHKPRNEDPIENGALSQPLCLSMPCVVSKLNQPVFDRRNRSATEYGGTWSAPPAPFAALTSMMLNPSPAATASTTNASRVGCEITTPALAAVREHLRVAPDQGNMAQHAPSGRSVPLRRAPDPPQMELE